jgi:hypothetical protein
LEFKNMGAVLQSLLDGSIPGSDPNASGYVQSQQQIARQQQLAQAMIDQGTSSAPIASPWQGAAQLAKAMTGALMNRQANQAQQLGQASGAADNSNYLNSIGVFNDPGQLNGPSTPGRTTPALQQNDAINDAISDAPGGPNSNAAILAALAASRGGQPPSVGGGLAAGSPPSNGNAALAAAVAGGAPAPAGGAGLDPQAVSAYVAQAAQQRGINPTVAGAILGGESSNGRGYVGDKGSSFGPLQLHYGNIAPGALSHPGLGDAFTAATGLDARDPSTWKQQIDFALDQAKTGGWGPWATTRDKLGYSNFTGIGSGAPSSPAYTNPSPAAPASAAIDTATTGRTWAQVQADAAAGDAAHNNYNAIPSPAPALGAINAATGYGGPTATAADGSAVPTNAQGYAIDPSTGRPTQQGAGAPSAASPSPSPVPAVGTMSGQPAAPAPAPAAPSPAPAPQSGMGGSGFHPDVASALNILNDPWASPAMQQMAQQMISAQMPTPPTYGVIGKGADGSESYGWIYPKGPNGPHVTDSNGNPVNPGQGGYNISSSPGGTSPPQGASLPVAGAPAPVVGAGTPQPQGNGAKIPNLPAIGATPEGLTWLSSVAGGGGNQAMVARKALAIINGQAQFPDGSGTGPTKSFDIAVADAVLKAAPGYSATLAASRAKAISEFQDKSTPNSRGGLVQNMNTAIGHLSDLSDLSEALPTNSDSTALPNALVNSAKSVLSQGPNAAGLARYNQAKAIVTEEVTKFYQGGSGTEGDRDAMIAKLSADASPSERRAGIDAISKLIQTKGTEIQRDWHQATSAPDGQQYDYPVYGAPALDGMARIAQRASPNFGGASPAATPPAIVGAIKANPQGALSDAKAAIAARPDLRGAIIQRLQAAGVDPTGL